MATNKTDKKKFLQETIQHFDMTKQNVVPVVEAMQHMAYSARDLHRAADIYDKMLKDKSAA
jgi:deoxyhypusine synthase